MTYALQYSAALGGGAVRYSHDAFVRAIAETPYDRLPGLVYADWLDERHPAGDHPIARVIRRAAHEPLTDFPFGTPSPGLRPFPAPPEPIIEWSRLGKDRVGLRVYVKPAHYSPTDPHLMWEAAVSPREAHAALLDAAAVGVHGADDGRRQLEVNYPHLRTAG